jgi:hypothetical protein
MENVAIRVGKNKRENQNRFGVGFEKKREN